MDSGKDKIVLSSLDPNHVSSDLHEHLELIQSQPPTIGTKTTKIETTLTSKQSSNLSNSETVLLGPLEETPDADEIIKDVLRRKKRESDLNEEKNDEANTINNNNNNNSNSNNVVQNEEQQKEERSLLRRMFFSQHTEDTFNQVWEIYSLFTKDLNMSTFQLLTTMHLCFLYYRDNAVHSECYLKGTNPKDIELMETISHYAKFAISIFGWAFQQWKNMSARGILDGVWQGEKLDREVICKNTGIDDKDVLTVSWVSEYFRPGYFIALDHSHRSIVCCVRGTFHIRDALTDLVAHSDKFKGGFAHRGMLRSAQNLYDVVRPIILNSLKDHPEYSVIFTGHSLGAGVASLISMIWNDEFSMQNMHCYAFAPPSIISIDLASRSRQFITTLIVNDDIVPRLSQESASEMKILIKHMFSQSQSLPERLFQIVSVGNALGSAGQKIASWMKWKQPTILTPDVRISAYTERLHLPGKIYHIWGESHSQPKLYDRVEESAPSLFTNIILSPTAYSDHMPDVYEDCIALVLKRLKEEANGTFNENSNSDEKTKTEQKSENAESTKQETQE